jgi:diaminopimelate decarboxylase
MFSEQLISTLKKIETPFYFYDTSLLQKTLFAIKDAADLFNYNLHYAIKANANKKILRLISEHKFGADCVSGNEIKVAIDNGFIPSRIVFAGVGKTDKEINYAIQSNIFSFNCESVQELEVINEIAKQNNKTVRVALRINPDINANTHRNITTGLKTNKFGIPITDLQYIISQKHRFKNLNIEGLHFHIGSQITDLSVFAKLCIVVNKIYNHFQDQNFKLNHINLGGGLGINYTKPENQIPDFLAYFKIFQKNLNIPRNVKIHFEPGRSIVGQCGFLFTKALFIKETNEQKTVIVDAGLTELLRPALYQASHKIINSSSFDIKEKYDIAGPICETSDYFGKSIELSKTSRGDILSIYSVGAYGEVMASKYNLRSIAPKYFSDTLLQESLI